MRVLLYGDVNLNIIDGSSIWVASMAEVLSNIADTTLVLKAPIENDRLTAPLQERSALTLIPQAADGSVELGSKAAARRLAKIAQEIRPDVVLVRGRKVCFEAAQIPSLQPLLWSYVTELPFPLHRATRASLAEMHTIASGSRRMLLQTESARSYVENLTQAAAGKTILLPPMVPDDAYHATRDSGNQQTIRLVYSGKLAEAWRTLEMLNIPRHLRSYGLQAELTVIGDKFQASVDKPHWPDEMRAALVSAHEDPTSGVRWLGGLPRDEALQQAAKSHYGLGWRDSSLDDSLEISTKALEYAAMGVPPIVNRTSDHEALWGSDYPFFLGEDSIDEVCRVLANGSKFRDGAASSAREAVTTYSMTDAQMRLEAALRRATPLVRRAARRTKVAIVSHDLKFMGELHDHLSTSDQFEVRIDAWKTLRDHDEAHSRTIVDWADVILCEWAGPSVVWYQSRVRPDQRLLTRLHRFELWAPWIRDIDFGKLASVIFVSDYFAAKAVDSLGIPEERVSVIPNVVDMQDLMRPKIPGSEFHLALVGMVSFGKRPDRALKLVKELLEYDDRYVLHIKGRQPWEYPYEWTNGSQRELYAAFYNSFRTEPSLLQHVVFEPFRADVGAWLRKIGVVLSPSTGRYESFHLAPAEGMASGASAVIWDRDGAREIFGSERVFQDLVSARDFVLSLRDPEARAVETENALAWARRWDAPTIMSHWDRILVGDSAGDKIQTSSGSQVQTSGWGS